VRILLRRIEFADLVVVQGRMTPIRASITGPPLSARQGKFRLGQLGDVLGGIPEGDERLPAKC
jgi:hypothetical protein